MKILLVIWLVCFAVSDAKVVKDLFGKKDLIRLSTEPFDVPPLNGTERAGRIVFGATASSGQFPHFAVIFVKRPTQTVQCGAGLISPSWVVSADHCVREAISIELRFGLTHRDYPEQKAYAKALARHASVDISLIMLKDSVRTTNLVKPALLPRLSQRTEMYVNQQVTVSGLGIDNQQTYSIPTYLKYANLRILSMSECARYFGTLADTTVCAKSDTSLASSCPGDSGSPLVLSEGSNTVIVGVVSFGAGSGCDIGYPVGYIRTTHQLDWIAYYTGLTLRK